MNNNNASNPTIQQLGYSPDALTQRKAELMALLAQAAPELISDQQLNVAKLQELLGKERLAADEHYELSWAGKTAARREIQKTSSHTLRPDANNPAQAQHMLIEGENLEVLRVLQKSYYGKVKMIYIDPPYNTGNDSFVYPDNYSETLDEYQRRTGEKNEAGYLNKQSLWKKNSKESGQYHSAWLSMMYPRLYLARNLLRDDGVIFISIDDNEAANLKVLCDEIFGAENFVAQFIWNKQHSQQQGLFKKYHEYVFLYARNVQIHENISGGEGLIDAGAMKKISKANPASDFFFPAGVRFEAPDNFKLSGTYGDSEQVTVVSGTLRALNGRTAEAVTLRAGWTQKEQMRAFFDGEAVVDTKGQKVIEFYLTSTGKIKCIKERSKITPSTLLPEYGMVSEQTGALSALLGHTVFDNPKPVGMIKDFLRWFVTEDELILDFFAGSGTTAQAVMELNLDDGLNRKSICVQMPEVVEKTSEAYKAGYRTIADITRARINKVIAKLKNERPDQTTELACAYFTLAPSNFKVWQGDMNSSEALREQLSIFQSAEKGGQRKQADAQTAMLTELLLKHGLGALGVHAIAKPRQVAGATVHRVLMVDDKTMWLCFEAYMDALKDEIVKAMPAHVVMLNSCFVGAKADEQLANLQLELAGQDIGLTVI
ncbi:MAG: site-specific DNA-methyltransferase [Comamonadaceae bacterium PBBC2]|nr:MAG: site-specific DNA-methyltransferase [Comamonadaceae bacterium PBBC2]